MGRRFHNPTWHQSSTSQAHPLARAALLALGLTDGTGRPFPFTLVRALYILSLLLALVLGLLALASFALSLSVREVRSEQISKTRDGWLLQLNIANRQDEEKVYRIDLLIDGKLYSEVATVAANDVLTHFRRIRQEDVSSGEFTVAVYKDGDPEPVTQTVYYLKD